MKERKNANSGANGRKIMSGMLCCGREDCIEGGEEENENMLMKDIALQNFVLGSV